MTASDNPGNGRSFASSRQLLLSRSGGKRARRFLRHLRGWVRQGLSSGASRRLQSPSIPSSNRNGFAYPVPSTPPSPDCLPPPSPPQSPSCAVDPITLRSPPPDSATADDLATALDSVTPGSNMSLSLVFTNNGASVMSPADSTTVSTTPLQPSCPGSPGGLPDGGETVDPRLWADAPKTDGDGRPRESFRRNIYMIGEDLKKVPMRASIDTQATFSALATDKVVEIGKKPKECEEMVRPLAVGSKIEVPVEGQVQADWHFLNGKETYTTNFRVLPMTDFDVLLGRDVIGEHGFVRMSELVPYEEGEVRRPGH